MSNSVFGLFASFCRLLVAFAVAVFLHYIFGNGFFAKAGNKLVIAFTFFLFDYEHTLKNRLLSGKNALKIVSPCILAFPTTKMNPNNLREGMVD